MSALAADRTLAAEGDYVAQGRTTKPLAHWKLWHLSSGEYEVVETLAKPANVEQVFRFDAHFLPRGFSLTINPFQKSHIPQGQSPPIKVYPTIVSCRLDDANLRCDIDNNGQKSTTKVPAKQPYVFVPGEFYALDYTWFLTGVARLAEQNGTKDEAVNVYVMVDDKLHVDQPVVLTYAGDETADLMGKSQAVREYRGQLGSEHEPWMLGQFSALQVTSLGIVASVKSQSGAVAMSNYKEYEPWFRAH